MNANRVQNVSGPIREMKQTRQKTIKNLSAVRATLVENETRSTTFLRKLHILEGIDSWIQLLLDCHAFAVDQRREQKNTDYMEAYAGVTSMAFTTAEVTRLLLLRGHFANCLGNIRLLATQNDLIWDLSHTAASASKWLELRSLNPAHQPKSQEEKELEWYFRDRAVRKRIKESGGEPLSERLYPISSEAVHGTPWASALFSPESLDKPGEAHLEYSPQYHPVRVFFYAMFLRSALPHLTGFFLEACEPDFKGVNNRYELLASRYLRMLETYESESPLLNAMLERTEEMQDRVTAGEDFDKVFAATRETMS